MASEGEGDDEGAGARVLFVGVSVSGCSHDYRGCVYAAGQDVSVSMPRWKAVTATLTVNGTANATTILTVRGRSSRGERGSAAEGSNAAPGSNAGASAFAPGSGFTLGEVQTYRTCTPTLCIFPNCLRFAQPAEAHRTRRRRD